MEIKIPQVHKDYSILFGNTNTDSNHDCVGYNFTFPGFTGKLKTCSEPDYTQMKKA